MEDTENKRLKRNAYMRDWNKANRVKVSAVQQKWVERNRERSREIKKKWRELHPEKSAACTANFAKANRGSINAKTARYHSRKIKASVKWANKEMIKRIYEDCPKGFHVDHIVPLKGKLVCGLHVENNLQAIPAIANFKKTNKFRTNDTLDTI